MMNKIRIKQMGSARIPTDVGEFTLYLYRSNHDEKEHLALVMGSLAEQKDVLVRIHSECFTGDVLGSLRCDCGQQLRQAMQLIAHEGAGMIIYLPQEGRGIGLLDKLRAYNLQDQGYDTVDANLMLGHEADARDYTIGGLILRDLGVQSLRLLTNNPLKIESLQKKGFLISARVPLEAELTAENGSYLATKVKRMRHLLNLKDVPRRSVHRRESLRQRLTAPAISPGATRPFVTLTYAQSLDGSITSRRDKSLAISNLDSRTMTHQLRSLHDAILVGIGTILADNPRLTVRLVEGRNPQPVILDSQLRFPLDAKLLRHATPWIATTEQADTARQHALEAAGARILRLPATQAGQVDLSALLTLLTRLGIKSLMVEGGAQVITSFLSTRLVDRVVLTIAPLLVGGLNAITTLIPSTTKGFPRLSNPHYEQLGNDMMVVGEVNWGEGSHYSYPNIKSKKC